MPPTQSLVGMSSAQRRETLRVRMATDISRFYLNESAVKSSLNVVDDVMKSTYEAYKDTLIAEGFPKKFDIKAWFTDASRNDNINTVKNMKVVPWSLLEKDIGRKKAAGFFGQYSGWCNLSVEQLSILAGLANLDADEKVPEGQFFINLAHMFDTFEAALGDFVLPKESKTLTYTAWRRVMLVNSQPEAVVDADVPNRGYQIEASEVDLLRLNAMFTDLVMSMQEQARYRAINERTEKIYRDHQAKLVKAGAPQVIERPSDSDVILNLQWS